MADTRISRLFHDLKQRGRKGLVAYITAGDPCPERTPDLVAALEQGGADLIELGVPFSDPIADGPVIQRAGERAIQAGTTMGRVLEIAARIRTRSQVPLLLFTYLNPVLRRGMDRVAAEAADCGIDGCLLIDAGVEEAGEYVGVMRRHGLDTVFLGTPTSTAHRLLRVAEFSSGFVYLVSRAGVTGERESLSGSVAPLVQTMRSITNLPLAVGFGISNHDQVRQTWELADAVAVGSAIMRLVEQNIGTSSLELRLESFIRELKTGRSA
jgi:tryptophan synthase alpha chain